MRKRDRDLINLSKRLEALGISLTDQDALRRIEMTLHRRAERECGDENGVAIERDEATGKPYWTYDAGPSARRGRYAIADKEAGALRRLRAIMAKYPALWFYHQGDPRGCALYVGRWTDFPEDKRLGLAAITNPEDPIALRVIDGYYTRGVAVCL